MIYRVVLTFGLLLLIGCTQNTSSNLESGDRPLRPVYVIKASDGARIQYSILDGINSLRRAAGLQTLILNAKLNAAAATHARDMSVQNRAWHFGSDGSSPLDRMERVGYEGTLLGENISETFESELETLAAWMETPATRTIIVAPEAQEMGFSWYQEPGGKIWWTLVTGIEAQQ
ncbi:CAP domain-containing protein [Planktomarina temperata]|nr:CAP domain-containing protein [Planktomarina temperata]